MCRTVGSTKDSDTPSHTLPVLPLTCPTLPSFPGPCLMWVSWVPWLSESPSIFRFPRTTCPWASKLTFIIFVTSSPTKKQTNPKPRFFSLPPVKPSLPQSLVHSTLVTMSRGVKPQLLELLAKGDLYPSHFFPQSDVYSFLT